MKLKVKRALNKIRNIGNNTAYWLHAKEDQIIKKLTEIEIQK